MDTPNAAVASAPAVPYTIRTIIEQMGGRGLRGALVYCGAHQLTYKCPPVEREARPGRSSTVTPEGLLDYEVGLTFRVNGKQRQHWTMLVAYEPDDTYSVYLWRKATPGEQKRGIYGAVLDRCDDVYWEDLKDVVEGMYDSAIKEHNGGFIPLSLG